MYNAKKYQASVKMGQAAEDLFVSIAETNNYSVLKATPYQDRMEHWDYELTKTINNNFIKRKIDVKAMKKINRADAEPTDKLYLIELNNVGGGKGWLYGKADGFAFQTKDSFVLVSQEELITKINTLIDVDADSIASTKNKKVYTIYDRKRYGNKDRFFYMKKEDLLSIKNKMIWDY